MCEQTTLVKVKIPADLAHEGVEKWKEKEIDSCIAPLVKALQDGGIDMRGSCCGHGRTNGMITLQDGRTLYVNALTEQSIDRSDRVQYSESYHNGESIPAGSSLESILSDENTLCVVCLFKEVAPDLFEAFQIIAKFKINEGLRRYESRSLKKGEKKSGE